MGGGDSPTSTPFKHMNIIRLGVKEEMKVNSPIHVAKARLLTCAFPL